jgi:hypothetical protein
MLRICSIPQEPVFMWSQIFIMRWNSRALFSVARQKSTTFLAAFVRGPLFDPVDGGGDMFLGIVG